MKSLVSLVQKRLGLRPKKIIIPYYFGLLIGITFDFISFLTRRKFTISSIRIKKFCATTQFNSDKALSVYTPPYSLDQALIKTIEHEFINPKNDDVLFFSE